MEQIMVTASQLKNAAGELRDLNTNFKTQVSAMENSESALKAQWQGEANEAFHAAFLNDKQQMDNFYNLIMQYCEALEEEAARYETYEAQNVNIASTRTYA